MMKFNSLVILLLCIFSLGYTQEMKQLKSTISTDIGSYRNRYIYPITNVIYTTSYRNDLLFSARIRSYGTLFYFSKTAYDLTPILEYKWIDKAAWRLYAGIGVDLRLRLDNDSRGTQASSLEPLVSIFPYFSKTKWMIKSPLWTRFYTNGIGVTLLPEIHYFFNQKWGVYGRYELSYFQQYNTTNNQFHQDCFVGIQKNF
jgi:hypothetical protein